MKPKAVEITHPEKTYYPKIHVTKGDIIAYYDKIADHMLPLMHDRPLMMMRFPEGAAGEFFYQKNVSDYFPEWIKRVDIPLKKGDKTIAPVCQNKETLLYLANQSMITAHIWLSTYDNLDYPDRLIFDLDPSDNKFEKVATIAFALKELLEKLEMTPFVMTTGSHGLHVVIPLDQKTDFHTSRIFATLCAQQVIKNNPRLATLEIRKEKRGKKVFIDTLRNQYGATSVAPYSLRAHPTAPIATPIDWKELMQKGFNSQTYTIENIFQHLAHKTDPWESLEKKKFNIAQALEKFKSLSL